MNKTNTTKGFVLAFAMLALTAPAVTQTAEAAETMRLDSGHVGQITVDDSRAQGGRFDVTEEVKHSGVGVINFDAGNGYKPFHWYFSRDDLIYLHPTEASIGFGNNQTRYCVRARAGKGAFMFVSFYVGTKQGGFDFNGQNDVHVRVEEGTAEIGRLPGWPMPAIDIDGKGKVQCGATLAVDGERVSVEEEKAFWGATELMVRPKPNGKYSSYQYRVSKQGAVIREKNPNAR